MPAEDTALIAELNTLLRLTRTETTLAGIRRAQARTEDIRRDIEGNLTDSRRRSQLIAAAIRDLGGVPDVVGAAAGHLAALAKSQVEQLQPLPDALLDELALIEQLYSRARYVKTLAANAKRTDIRRLAERLERSHAQTIEWIETRLAEVAVGAPPAIQPTPVQRISGAVRKALALPVRGAAVGVNRTASSLHGLARKAEETFSEQLRRAEEIGDAAREVATTGRDAALGRVEEIAQQRRATGTAKSLHEARSALGALEPEELPIKNYDKLDAPAASKAVQRLREPKDVAVTLAYEAAHRDRVTVRRAAEQRLDELAGDDARPGRGDHLVGARRSS